MKYNGSIFKEDQKTVEPPQKDWATFISEKRAGQEMTIDELAQKAGVGARTLKAWNQGGGMYVESLELVLQALGYTLKAVKND